MLGKGDICVLQTAIFMPPAIKWQGAFSVCFVRHSVIPSFRHSVIPSHESLSSQLLLHPCMDLNETWQGCCTTSVEVHVGR